MKRTVLIFGHDVEGDYRGKQKVFRLKEMQNVATSRDLPTRYLEGVPIYVKRDQHKNGNIGDTLCYANEKSICGIHQWEELPIGCAISIENFEEMINILKKAGQRLSEIIKEEQYEKWEGKSDIEIII